MKKIFLLYAPGFIWSEIISGVDKGNLPAFDKLITHGATGKTFQPSPTTSMNEASTLITGTPAEKHCCVQPFEDDPNNLVLQETTRRAIMTPMLHELCSSNNIPAAAVNWPGSHNPYGQPNQPLVISDRFVKSCTFSKSFKHITLESISDDAFIPEASQLQFHEDETNSEVLDFFGITSSSPVFDAFKHQFAATVTVHNMSTYLLDSNRYDMLCCTYDTFEKIHRHAGFQEVTKIAMIRYFDIMLSSILKHITSDPESCLFFYSGGRNRQPGFFAAYGSSIKPDHLLKEIKAEQVAPTIMDMFHVTCSHFHHLPIKDIYKDEVSDKKHINKIYFYNPPPPMLEKYVQDTNKKLFIQKALLISESLKQQTKYKELIDYLSSFIGKLDDQELKLALVEAFLLSGNSQEANNLFKTLDIKTKQMEQGQVLALWLNFKITLEEKKSKYDYSNNFNNHDSLSENTLRRLSKLLIEHKLWHQALSLLHHKKLKGTDSYRDYLKSVCLFHLKQYERSEVAIKEALRRNAQVGFYWLHLGKVYLEQKELPKAINAFMTAIKNDGKLYEAKEYLKKIL